MRIINGELGGRKPVIPGNLRARPTTDIAREGLFNILRNRIDFESTRVLDLFSGTGIISFEFASLGSPEIVAVEKDRIHCAAIRRNMELLGIKTMKIIEGDVFHFLMRSPQPFDVIFADPPYDHPLVSKLPELVLGHQWLLPEGFFVLEHGPDKSFSGTSGYFEERKYGKVHFSFFRD